VSYFPLELRDLDFSGDITSWRTIRHAPAHSRLLANGWERFECALFHGWNTLLILGKKRLPAPKLAGESVFPLAKMEQFLDWTVGAHLDAYSGIYDAAKADYYRHHLLERFFESPVRVVAHQPRSTAFGEEADSIVLYHYRQLRAHRVHRAAIIMQRRGDPPKGLGSKCNWYFRSLGRSQMERCVNNDPHLRNNEKTRNRLIQGIPVFEFVVSETFPSVMGQMLSLIANYLHESEKHLRALVNARKTGNGRYRSPSRFRDYREK
jgi:hypothetical protein